MAHTVRDLEYFGKCVRLCFPYAINEIRQYFGKMFEALVAQMPKLTEAVECPNSFYLFCLSFLTCV